MPLVNTTEMFKKAYEGGYAIGAFNVNNMEIIQGITEACHELRAPVILQVSAGARKYANHTYLTKLVEAAVLLDPELPIALHLDHGPSFELCKDCIDGGFTSVMFDGSSKPYEENVEEARRVAEYAHKYNVTVEAELGQLAGIEDEVSVDEDKAHFTDPDQVEDFVKRTGVDSLAIAIGTSHGAYKFKPGPLCCTALRPLFPSLWRRLTSTAGVCPTRSAFRKKCCVRRPPWRSARSTSIPICAWR